MSEFCDGCDGTGLMEGWNRRDGNSCPKCKGSGIELAPSKSQSGHMPAELTPFVVEAEEDGCSQCGHGVLYSIVYKPDDMGSSTIYGNKEEAEDIAELQNDAYQKGASAYTAVLQQCTSALIRAERKLRTYVGVCTGDKELTGTVLPMCASALAEAEKLRGA